MKLKHLSASRIGTFRDCAWKYYAKYEAEYEDLPSHPLTNMGSCCHHMFEGATKARIGHSEGSKEPMDYRKAACEKYSVEPNLVSLLESLTKNAISWGYFRNIHRTVGAEVEINFELPDGTKVTGFIDRLDVWDDKADINDLKTQKREFDDATLKKNWQARIYNIGARDLYPQVTGKAAVSFWVLRHRVQRVFLTAGDASDDIQELVKIAEEIRNCSEPKCSPSGLCRYCPGNKHCPATKK